MFVVHVSFRLTDGNEYLFQAKDEVHFHLWQQLSQLFLLSLLMWHPCRRRWAPGSRQSWTLPPGTTAVAPTRRHWVVLRRCRRLWLWPQNQVLGRERRKKRRRNASVCSARRSSEEEQPCKTERWSLAFSASTVFYYPTALKSDRPGREKCMTPVQNLLFVVWSSQLADPSNGIIKSSCSKLWGNFVIGTTPSKFLLAKPFFY